jgi:hypothetical protein
MQSATGSGESRGEPIIGALSAAKQHFVEGTVITDADQLFA